MPSSALFFHAHTYRGTSKKDESASQGRGMIRANVMHLVRHHPIEFPGHCGWLIARRAREAGRGGGGVGRLHRDDGQGYRRRIQQLVKRPFAESKDMRRIRATELLQVSFELHSNGTNDL